MMKETNINPEVKKFIIFTVIRPNNVLTNMVLIYIHPVLLGLKVINYIWLLVEAQEFHLCFVDCMAVSSSCMKNQVHCVIVFILDQADNIRKDRGIK